MIIRPYIPNKDFDAIKRWITDERTHAMWCAFRMPYPLTREVFDEFLEVEKAKYNNAAYTAETDEGKPIGFYCLSTGESECMLKFVVISPEVRGKGIGRAMITSAVKLGFEAAQTNTIGLCVFDCNEAARKCYINAGFKEVSHTDDAFHFKNEVWGRIYMTNTRVN
ncbi:MAG: GNAT family N-acetyltransferase [Ruminococcus sp.]|nr:GNAT family N-acetyltransferase [Ruminococcus sp.]